MLENPSVVVGYEDGVQTCGEGGVDIRLGAVADHPGGVRWKGVLSDDGAVGGFVLLGYDLDGGKIFLQSRALDFSGLLGGVSFGHQDEVVELAEILQGFGHAGENFNRMPGDLVGKAANAFVQAGRDRIDGKPLEGLNQRMREAVQAVAVPNDRFSLNVVQHHPNHFGRVFAMVEERNELGNRPFEIDVVFPERVIGIDEQSLSAILSGHPPMIAGRADSGCGAASYERAGTASILSSVIAELECRMLLEVVVEDLVSAPVVVVDGKDEFRLAIIVIVSRID